ASLEPRRQGIPGGQRIERGADMIGKAAEEGHERDLSWFKGLKRALSQLGQHEKPCAAAGRRRSSKMRRAPPRRRDTLSSDVIFELFGRQLEADEQFKAGALHRRSHLGQAER